MRSRKSMMENLHAIAIEERSLRLTALSKLDARLLRAMIPSIPYDQAYYPKGRKTEVTLDGVVYYVSCDQDLLIVSRNPLKLYVIECIENAGDLIHYRYLGRFQREDDGWKLIPSVIPSEAYFIDFDIQQPRSAAFQSVVGHWLGSHSSLPSIYKRDDVSLLSMNGLEYLLHIKVKGMIHVRPSTSQKRASEKRMCMEVVAAECLGKGGYGLVSRAPTHRFIMGELQKTENARVTKAIEKRVSFRGVEESVAEFKARILQEQSFAQFFGLKAKPPIFDWPNKRAYLTMREAPGVLLSSWLKGAPIDADKAYRVSLACLKALADLHAKQVIHGDLKNNNIMVHEQPDGEVVAQLLDAGAASFVDELVRFCAVSSHVCPESANDMKGKSGYFPFNSQEADVYALGIDLAALWGFAYNNDSKNQTMNRYKLGSQPKCVDGLDLHEAKDIRTLLQGVLDVSPSHRLTAKRAFTQLSGYYKSRLKSVSLDGSSSPLRRLVK